MSCYYSTHRKMLVLKCDGCGRLVDLYNGETDRTLANDYIHENGWKTMKDGGKWINICHDCVAAMQEQKRRAWVDSKVSTQ